jgi:V/A-type H+/Na+-transporting ATPase subunit A
VISQQDAFDKIDCRSSFDRQRYMLEKVVDVLKYEFKFDSFEEVNPYFKKVINQFKQMNYSEFKSEEFKKNEKDLETIIQERKVA